jgi:5-methyltetrahydropteroyltriglutamate--homocysteine methyltransferase
VRERVAAGRADDGYRTEPFAVRAQAQRARLSLPPLPTTTIGSFPQTADIRRARAARSSGRLTDEQYQSAMRKAIDEAISVQQTAGLDVLVHGEPERNDMVEYFGGELTGMLTTEHGWVQSYGSRCVKPPVIYGDVSRPRPITLDWIRYAQSRTNKPVKGMLTGPVTIMKWSFVRDDLPPSEVAEQIAWALHDEVADLQASWVGIVQIDEPAFREAMPLRDDERASYVAWATRAFRIAASAARTSTQIHTHMCYSDVNDVMEAVEKLDADVLTVEAARSGFELLNAIAESGYAHAIGPGVYDVHSPAVPDEADIERRIGDLLRAVPADRLWVNPDCGLKTRRYEEALPALTHMVAATRRVRASLKL